MIALRTEQVDITTLATDAIVNAAAPPLLGGGGVDGAIHRAAGPDLLHACRKMPEVEPGVRCPTGEARITRAFKLRARYVIHTVGPIWHGGGHHEERLLADCYRAAIALAHEFDLKTIAFPAISCGVYGYPKEAACSVAVRTLRECTTHSSLEEVVLVAFDATMSKLLTAALSGS